MYEESKKGRKKITKAQTYEEKAVRSKTASSTSGVQKYIQIGKVPKNMANVTKMQQSTGGRSIVSNNKKKGRNETAQQMEDYKWYEENELEKYQIFE